MDADSAGCIGIIARVSIVFLLVAVRGVVSAYAAADSLSDRR
jgi:hypothetical protein